MSVQSPTTVPPQVGITGTNFLPGSTGTGSTAPSTAAAGNPLISQDQSAFTQYVISTVGGYPVDIGNLLSGAAQTTTVGQALQDLYDLSSTQLRQVQAELLNAGFYTNADGTPLTSEASIVLGQMDALTWQAMARALAEAATSGQSLGGLLQANEQAGLGAAEQNTLPSPVLGGGNNYNIDLSNPKDVLLAATQIFQSALGRNPTASEVSSITADVNNQTLAQGYAQEAGAEQAGRARYGASVNQRNIAYQFQRNPKVAFGPVPSGPFGNNAQWAAALLGYMGLPVSAANVAFITQWANQTKGPQFNPLAAQNPSTGSTPGPSGAAQYQTAAQGIQATAAELYSSKYAGLIAALQTGDPATNTTASSSAVTVWSNGALNSINPTSATQKQAAAMAQAYQTQTAGRTPGAATGPGPGYGQGTAQSTGGEGGGPNAGAPIAPGNVGPGYGQGTAQSTGGEGGGPGALTTVSPPDIGLGQQPPNPGDQYVNPVTSITTNPASPSVSAYTAATTGANRPAYLGNEYLNALNSIVSMFKAGGMTGG